MKIVNYIKDFFRIGKNEYDYSIEEINQSNLLKGVIENIYMYYNTADEYVKISKVYCTDEGMTYGDGFILLPIKIVGIKYSNVTIKKVFHKFEITEGLIIYSNFYKDKKMRGKITLRNNFYNNIKIKLSHKTLCE